MPHGARFAEFVVVPAVLVGIVLGAWVITESAPIGPPGKILGALGAVLIDGVEPADPVPLYDFIEVMDGCDIHYAGACVLARATPGTTSPEVARLRKGMVLEVATTTLETSDGTWYKVVFREWVRYPTRLGSDWYVAASDVRHFVDVGGEDLTYEGQQVASTTKRIVIDRSEQKLYAYDGDVLFMETPTSTGLDLTPTPRGTFTVYRKTPTRYMQGPLPGISDQYYDLPGVPWDLYFTDEGGAIHGAYWHNSFGTEWSHGCVNLPLATARTLYYWAPLGTQVVVQD